MRARSFKREAGHTGGNDNIFILQVSSSPRRLLEMHCGPCEVLFSQESFLSALKFDVLLVKPCRPNGLASRRKFRLATHLRWLALTLVEHKFVRKSTQVFTVWPSSAIRHKFGSQVHCIRVKFTTFCDLRELASRLANPFGHPSQVRTQVLVLQTCVDLRVRLAAGFYIAGLPIRSLCKDMWDKIVALA